MSLFDLPEHTRREVLTALGWTEEQYRAEQREIEAESEADPYEYVPAEEIGAKFREELKIVLEGEEEDSDGPGEYATPPPPRREES